ncbi:hypothetical protein [Paenibacillus mesotrionivorans]|uniref:Uncharacterized protein n=1 Tax=Paenibacillus mesotrionivorans TaxID=3160968 RepID=A0ACC7NYC8_9BACL
MDQLLVRKTFLDYMIKHMHGYNLLGEKALTEMLSDIKDDTKESSDSYSMLAQELYIQEKLHTAVNIYPNHFYSSLVLTIYSFLEGELLEVCKILHITRGFPSSDEEQTRDRGIRRSKKYIEKYTGISVDQGLWEEILELNRMRNIIAHHGPDFNKKLQLLVEQNLGNHVQKYDLLKETPYRNILLSSNYCGKVIDLIKVFLEQIYTKIQAGSSLNTNK